MRKINILLLCGLLLIYSTASFGQINEYSIYRKPCPSLSIIFDLQNMVDSYSLQIAYQIYDPLFTFDEFLQIHPHLVETFEQQDDGKIYIINLRKNIKFHNGKTLTSDDVIYTLERFIKKNYTYFPELQSIAGADFFVNGKKDKISGLQKISDFSFRLELRRPVATLLYVLSTPNLGILPNKLLGLSETVFFSKPMGTGPFKFLSYSKDKLLELEKNENYFLGAPRLDKLVYEYATKEQAIEGFNKGYYHDLQWVFNPRLEDIKVSYNVTKVPLPSVSGIVFNTAREPFNNANVRRYIATKINTDRLFESCFSSNIKANDFIPYGFGGHNQSIAHKTVTNPISKPQKLKNFTILRLENHPCHGDFDKIIQESFLPLGVNVDVKYITYQDFINYYYPQRNYDLIELSIYADYPDAQALLNYFRSSFPDNFSSFSSTEFDALVAKSINTNDKYERYKLYQEAENILLKESVIIPVYYNIETIIFQKRVEGIVPPTFTLSSLSMRSAFFKE